jgi:hypothetical protein
MCPDAWIASEINQQHLNLVVHYIPYQSLMLAETQWQLILLAHYCQTQVSTKLPP